jgi:hypothetical protein
LLSNATCTCYDEALLRGVEQQLSASRQDHARERDAHAREAERRAELQESLAAARWGCTS